ncbi:MAG: hypothetical protein JW940_17975 [Polyangiaceae bacterium]|nr:hypothetical protein [Polyangiaceae bacterium]
MVSRPGAEAQATSEERDAREGATLDDLLEPVVAALLPLVENEAQFTRAAKAALVYGVRYQTAVQGRLLKQTLLDLDLSKSYVSRHGRETAALDFLTVVHRVFADLGAPATLGEVAPLLPKLRHVSEFDLVEAAVERGFLTRTRRGSGLPDQYEANPNARFVPTTRTEQLQEVRESLRCFVRAALAQIQAAASPPPKGPTTAGSRCAVPRNARLVRTEFHAPSDMDPRMVNEIVLKKLREAMEEIDAARSPGDTGKLVRVTSSLQTQQPDPSKDRGSP